MTDIQSRPFSKNYSGLINQSVIGIGIAILCVAGQEFLRRRRRGKALFDPPPGFGSRETWQCGYLYQARSWARFPSPPPPAGWPLSWVKQAVYFPEDKLRELRGIDATIYVRFLRGCFWYALLHLLTTFPVLFPIHIDFSEESISPKSMTRASISSLVGTAKGRSLLWIHICLYFWLAGTWIVTLFWICDGAFKMRAIIIEDARRKAGTSDEFLAVELQTYYRHPRPQYRFTDVPSLERDRPVQGLRLRTIMVTNIPQSLRTEKDLQEYFEYYMSRKVEKPAVGITSSTQPGFLNKSLAFLLNRAKRAQARVPNKEEIEGQNNWMNGGSDIPTRPVIERVVIVRKMTELASLLSRREEILVLLEVAHIKLANKALLAAKTAMERHPGRGSTDAAKNRTSQFPGPDAERGNSPEGATYETEQLVKNLRPFVEDFAADEARQSKLLTSKFSRLNFHKLPTRSPSDDKDGRTDKYPPFAQPKVQRTAQPTVWDALLSLPRSALDAYQPLIHLNRLFSGKVVPSIDYYTAKLNLLSSLITENRAKPATDFDPTSTAFVTFADPADARRACKYLAVHPNNPLACLVTMAPMYSDIDWMRLMKSSLKVEFVKDWVVSLGVWAFTIFWLFPVSLLVGLVSIQNISVFWPSLKQFLDRNPDKSEILQSLIPTLLVSLLSLLIPPILLLIAKKIHLITTLSALHDMLLTRYYKFLVVNVLIFFCVGTAAMQSLLQSFTSSDKRKDVIQIVADSFPTAGPFYVGWLIFSTALHGGIELSLFGVCDFSFDVNEMKTQLPLILHAIRIRQVVPRKRSLYTRPQTPNFYYWFPNHCLVLHILLLFGVLNPFVLPFGTLYFFVQTGVIKNQLIHVYAKNFEGNGKILLIRIVRYSLDGLVLSQVVFMAYMIVLRKSVIAGLAAFLVVATILVKMVLTRICRAQFELDDAAEADAICNDLRYRQPSEDIETESAGLIFGEAVGQEPDHHTPSQRSSFLTIRLPDWINLSYATFNRHHRGVRQRTQHRPNPFGPHRNSGLTATLVHQRNTLIEGLPQSYLAEEPKEDPFLTHSASRVTRHPPPPPWDDQDLLDLPYDNPFYSRAIDNALWLPRNPLGLLDLDDTVDLRISIAVDESASRLGSWIAGDRNISPSAISTSEISLPGSDSHPSPATRFPLELQELDGTEEINLPPIISQRIQSGEKDIERTVKQRRPSLLQMRTSFSSDQGAERFRRPSLLDPPTSYTASANGPKRARSGSVMSILQFPSQGLTVEKGKVPEQGTHAQADFVAANSSASRMSSTSRTQTVVSTAQAIFHELLEEEREALHDRMEKEVEAQTQVSKSWFSWLYITRDQSD